MTVDRPTVGASSLALFGSNLHLRVVRSRPVPLAPAALLVASNVAITARIVLLAYTDVTSFRTAAIYYTSPASPFAIIFTVIGCWCLVRCLFSERLRRRLFADRFLPSNSVSYGGDRSSRIPQ